MPISCWTAHGSIGEIMRNMRAAALDPMQALRDE
jgi:hypothetical protein